jgi:Cdc6-like AAA superfamily ATPase
MTEKIGRLFPVGGPVPPDLVIGRAGEVAELERRCGEELHTMLVGPRRIGKTTVCEAVCDRLRRDGAAVVAIEVPERPDSTALLQLLIDRCSRLSHQAQGRRVARIARPFIEKTLAEIGVPLDLGALASDAVSPTREVLSLPVQLARETNRPVLVFFDELQRAVDYADGEQLLIDVGDDDA